MIAEDLQRELRLANASRVPSHNLPRKVTNLVYAELCHDQRISNRVRSRLYCLGVTEQSQAEPHLLFAPSGPVPAAFSTRVGGVSAPPFDSLNFGNPGELPAGIDVNPFPTIDQAVVKMLYDAGADITFYVQGEAKPGDLYSTHMADAQSAMKAERYFDAEEHFGRALSYKPGDVTALMGRAHAQIGAGLLISASANLRSIFEQHPELIAARFSGEAGIPEQRANDMIAHLRRHLVPGADPLSSVPKETGLLLAYLGFQRSDTAAINNGLDVLMRLDEDIRANKPDAKPDALLSLLRAVWLYGVEPANLP